MNNICSKVPEDVTRAFANLQESNNPNFKMIMDWLKECRKAEEAGYDRLVEKDLLWCQGRHQAINVCIEASESARDRLNKKK